MILFTSGRRRLRDSKKPPEKISNEFAPRFFLIALGFVLAQELKSCEATQENHADYSSESLPFGARIKPLGDKKATAELLDSGIQAVSNATATKPSHQYQDNDLIVAPATLQSYQTNARNPFNYEHSSLEATGSQQQDDNPLVAPRLLNQQLETSRGKPTLAQLTAAATAAGIIVGDLVGQQSELYNNDDSTGDDSSPEEVDPIERPMSAQNLNFQDDGIRNVISQGKRKLPYDEAALGSRLTRLNNAPVAVYNDNQPMPRRGGAEQVVEEASLEFDPERAPDSIEGLMRAGGEDVSDLQDPNDETGSDSGDGQAENLGTAASGQLGPTQVEVDDNDDDDESDEDGDGGPARADQQTDGSINTSEIGRPLLIPMGNSQLARSSSSYEAPIPYEHLIALNANKQLGLPLTDSSEDLNTAAGHYYKKKKKKKVVKKKKKKKVVVKKKKKKKVYHVKKVKIVKVKKKKKKKKKKGKKKHHHDHGKYYMYAKVPKKKSWEFGFKKGNKKHWIERHEKGHKNKFKTKVKWYDKKSKGKGFHVWDYNHHDKKKKHYG